MYITGDDGYQNFFEFSPMFISLILDTSKKVTNWISTGISSEKLKPFDTNLEPTMSNLANGRVILKCNNSVLVQNFFSSLCSDFILNLYIAQELNTWPHNPTNNFTLKNCLFGTVKFTRNANTSKFTYNCRGIAFDGKGYWSFENDPARNVIIFGDDKSSSFHLDNPQNNFLVLGKKPTEGINGSVGAAEKKLVLTLVEQI